MGAHSFKGLMNEDVLMIEMALSLPAELGLQIAVLEGQIAEADVGKLRQFVKRMAKVRGTKLLIRGFKVVTGISFSDAVPSVLNNMPSRAEVSELLHALRPVTLKKEPYSFDKIRGVVGGVFKNRAFSDYLKHVCKLYEDGEASLYMKMTVSGQSIYDESFLNLWLNGVEYHNDADKEGAWERLSNSLTQENANALVVNQLHSRIQALFGLEYIVHLILGQCGDPLPACMMADEGGGVVAAAAAGIEAEDQS